MIIVAFIYYRPHHIYKQIDVTDFLKYLKERYSDHTAKSYVNYFDKYATIFFSTNPDVLLLKLAPHKRSWILQAIKRLGDYYYRKYNNREVIQLIREIIERYDLKAFFSKSKHFWYIRYLIVV